MYTAFPFQIGLFSFVMDKFHVTSLSDEDSDSDYYKEDEHDRLINDPKYSRSFNSSQNSSVQSTSNHRHLSSGETEVENQSCFSLGGATSRIKSCRALGLILAVLSAFMYAIHSSIVKLIPNIHTLEIATFRYFLQAAFIAPIMVCQKQPFIPDRKDWFLLLIRAIIGGAAHNLFYYSITLIPLADASAIYYSSPVYTGIMACVLLHEPCGLFEALVTMLSLSGVIFITRPVFLYRIFKGSISPVINNATITPSVSLLNNSILSSNHLLTPGNIIGAVPLTNDLNNAGPFETLNDTVLGQFQLHEGHERLSFGAHNNLAATPAVYYSEGTIRQHLLGSLLAFVAAVCLAGNLIAIRSVRHVPYGTVIWCFGVMAGIISLVVTLCVGELTVPSTREQLLLLLGLGFATVLGQICITYAMRLEKAGPTAIARSLEIVFAFLCQFIFFHEAPTWYSFFGSTLVISSVVFLGIKAKLPQYWNEIKKKIYKGRRVATNTSSRKKKRPGLPLGEDRNRHPYVKQLKWVYVANFEEALSILDFGLRNRNIAATRFNQNSSRSHCIFSIKLIRVLDIDQPSHARVSILSVCDLAGAERINKTEATGDRQKECGKINQSLLTLGQCIEVLRNNQTHSDKSDNIPFRNSKLTRLFQNFFTGIGRAAMIVNISPRADLFDETLHALKFSAIAKEVHFARMIEPSVQSVEPVPTKQEPPLKKPLLNETVPWASPATIRSYQQNANMTLPPLFESTSDLQTVKATPFASSNDIEESMAEDMPTPVPVNQNADGSNETDSERVSALRSCIARLKEELAESLKLRWKRECDIRKELTKDFNDRLVRIETEHQAALQKREVELETLNEQKLEILRKRAHKRAKPSPHSDNGQLVHVDGEEYVTSLELHRAQTKIQEHEEVISDLRSEIDDLQKRLETQQEHNEQLKSDVTRLQIDKSTMQFELCAQRKQNEAAVGSDEKKLNEKVADLQTQLQAQTSLNQELQKDVTRLEEDKSIMQLELTTAKHDHDATSARLKDIEEALKEQELESSSPHISQELTENFEKLENENIRLQEMLEKAQIDLMSAEQDREELKKELAQLEDISDEACGLQFQVRDLEAIVKRMKQEKEEMPEKTTEKPTNFDVSIQAREPAPTLENAGMQTSYHVHDAAMATEHLGMNISLQTEQFGADISLQTESCGANVSQQTEQCGTNVSLQTETPIKAEVMCYDAMVNTSATTHQVQGTPEKIDASVLTELKLHNVSVNTVPLEALNEQKQTEKGTEIGVNTSLLSVESRNEDVVQNIDASLIAKPTVVDVSVLMNISAEDGSTQTQANGGLNSSLLNTNLKDVLSSLEDLRRTNRYLEDSLKKKDEEIAEYEFQLTELQSTMSVEVDLDQQKLSELRQQYEKSTAEVDCLTRQNKQLTDQIQQLKAVIDDGTADRANFLTEVKAMKSELHQISSLKMDLAKRREELHEKNLTLEKFKQEQEDLKQRLAQLSKEFTLKNSEFEELRTDRNNINERLADLTKKFEEKVAQFEELKADNTRMKERLTDAEGLNNKVDQFEEMKTELDETRNNLTNVTKEFDRKIIEFQELKIERDQMRERIAEVNHVFDGKVAQLQEMETKYDQLKDNFAAHRKESDEKLAEMKAERDHVTEQLASITKDLNEKTSELQDVKTEKDNIKQCLLDVTKERDEKISEFVEMKVQRDQINERLSKTLKELGQKVSEFETVQSEKCLMAEKLKAEFDKELEEKNQAIQQLNDMVTLKETAEKQVQDLNNRIQDMATAMQKKSDEVRSLQERLERKKETFLGLEKSVTDLEKLVADKTTELNKLRSNRRKDNTDNDLVTENRYLQDELDRRQATINTKMALITNLQLDMKEIKPKLREVTSLHSELDALKKEVDAKSTMIKTLEDDKMQLLKDLDAKTTSLGEISAELSDLRQNQQNIMSALKEEFAAKLNDKEETCVSLKSKIDSLTQNMEHLEAELKAKSGKSDRKRSSPQLDDLERRLTELTDELRVKEKELAASNVQLDKSKKEREQLLESLGAKSSALEEKTAELNKFRVDRDNLVERLRAEFDKKLKHQNENRLNAENIAPVVPPSSTKRSRYDLRKRRAAQVHEPASMFDQSSTSVKVQPPPPTTPCDKSASSVYHGLHDPLIAPLSTASKRTKQLYSEKHSPLNTTPLSDSNTSRGSISDIMPKEPPIRSPARVLRARGRKRRETKF